MGGPSSTSSMASPLILKIDEKGGLCKSRFLPVPPFVMTTAGLTV
jgi:hypothetical protein